MDGHQGINLNKKVKSKLTSLSTSHQSAFHTLVIVLEVNGAIVGSGNTVIDGKFKSYLVPTSFTTSKKCLTFGTANCAIMVIVIPTENTNYRGVSSYQKLDGQVVILRPAAQGAY